VIDALRDPAPERSLDALCALRAMCEEAPNGADCPRTDAGLRAALRTALARPAAETEPRVQERIIEALTSLRDTEALPLLRALVLRPLAEQEIRTLRAAADGLGAMRDVEGAEALIYGLFVNARRASATNNCTRALVRIGADAAVPRLIETLRPEGNPRVTQLLTSYGAVPETSPAPPGFQQSAAIDALRTFADPRGIDPLLALLRDDPAMRLPGQAHVGTSERTAAGETLAYTALTLPVTDPRRTQVFDAIAAAFRAGTPGGEDDMAPSLAPALVLLGDARVQGLLITRLRAPALRGGERVPYRIGLLMPLASALRRANVAAFDALARTAETDLAALLAANPDAAGEIRPVRAQLETIRAAAGVARDCADGDLACYRTRLGSADRAVARKAAYMIAWTVRDDEAARQALLEHVDTPDPQRQRSILLALDSRTPNGCAACVTRLEEVVNAVRGQESRAMMNLEIEIFLARLRARAR
jgi:PBS lyase HEAT-like repeat